MYNLLYYIKYPIPDKIHFGNNFVFIYQNYEYHYMTYLYIDLLQMPLECKVSYGPTSKLNGINLMLQE